MSSEDAILARLTAPGGPFEVVVEDVLGERMPVIKNRPRSLRELLERSRAHGDKEYVVHGERRITFAEHFELAASVAHALRDRYGIRPGDRVAILAENRAEWVLAFWASVSIGAVVAALNGWWQGDEIRHGIEDTEPALLIADRKRLERLGGRAPGVPVLEIDTQFAELERHKRGAGLPDVAIAEDDPAVILFTSGTTGRSKGAVNSHRGICGFVSIGQLNGLRNMLLAAERGVKPQPNAAPLCNLVTSPLFHLSGLYSGAVMMLASGGKTVWRSGRFDPGEVLRLIQAERVTHWGALGNMAYRVVSHPDIGRYDLSSVVNVGSGGGPTSRDIQERIRKVFPGGGSIGIGYGLSESVTAVCMIGGEELREFPDSVGRPMPTHELEVRGPDGRALPEGAEGEIYIRSPYLMLGYWGRPDATAETLLPGRWLRTGDIGRYEDGRLYINSRARDMILRGGENIYPVEIEHRLEAHPDVAEAAVFGIDHPELFQEVKAVVVTAPGARLDARALAEWVGAALAAYKVPAHWELRRDPLPRNAAGKILKQVLRGDSKSAFVEE
jgi:acyl-CoA synthetase (AMP-forming)/AMP-acid ligase II